MNKNSNAASSWFSEPRVTAGGIQECREFGFAVIWFDTRLYVASHKRNGIWRFA